MKANAKIVVMMIAAVLPSIGFTGDIFPLNPVPMTEGYGKDGAGLHFAIPDGVPGPDCAVNPVSFRWHNVTETTTKQVEVKTVVPGDTFSIPANVLFDFDKDFLRPEGKVALDDLSAKFVELGVKEVMIVGHTDAKGTDEYNLALGQRRASAVKEYLDTVVGYKSEAGLADGIVFNASSKGEAEPVAPNTLENGADNPAGRQLNRRVDLTVVTTDKTTIEFKDEVTETVVRKERNPQVFHVLTSSGRVTCGAEVGTTLGSPQLFFWGWDNSRR